MSEALSAVGKERDALVGELEKARLEKLTSDELAEATGEVQRFSLVRRFANFDCRLSRDTLLP